MAELTPSKWKDRLNRSIKLRKVRLDEARRFQRAYTGDYNEKPSKGLDEDKDAAVVNFIFSFIETTMPSILTGMPKIFLDPKTPESEASTRNLQANINYWFRELGLKPQFFRCLFDSYFSHYAFLTEWDFQEETIEAPLQIGVDPMTGKPIFDPTRTTPRRVTVVDQPLARRIDPWDVILDPDSKDRSLDRWRAMELLMTKEEFDSLPGVGSKMKEKISAQQIPDEAMSQPLGKNRDYGGSDVEWVTLYKIYDLENETVKLLPAGEAIDDFVEIKEWPFHFEVENDRFPITVRGGKTDVSNPYPFSEFKAYWVQIQEKNRFRTMIQSHVRRHSPGWLGKKGAMDEEQKQKFLRMKIGEYVEANNPDAIKTKPLPDFPQDSFAYNNIISDDLLDSSGFAEYRNDSIADTATEASILEGRSSVRKGAKKEEFFDFIAVVGAKIGGLCQQFQSVQVSERIRAAKNPREYEWINASKENIQGEFSYVAKPGVMQNQDEGLKRQQTLKMAEVMANNPHVDQRRLAEKLLTVFDFEPEEILRPEEQVQKEQEAQMEANEKEEKPNIEFNKIDIAALPPPLQAMVLQAAMKQNDVTSDGSMDGMPTDIAEMQMGGMEPSPSMDQAPMNSVMPGAEINQAPPVNNSAKIPPSSSVMPFSESQGG